MKPRTRMAILAQARSGSTMLCFALSNHPEVFCSRGEVLDRKNSWRWAFGGAGTPWGSKVYKRIIGLALSQYGYQACATKVNWALGAEEVWDWLALVKDPPVRAIYLKRDNLLRQVVSAAIRTATKGRPEERDHAPGEGPYTLAIEPAVILEKFRILEQSDVRARGLLNDRGMPFLSLTYTDLIGREGREAYYIEPEASLVLCDWLRVQRRELLAWPIRKVNGYPLSRLLTNWSEIEAVIAGSRWAWCLEDEARWN